MHLSFRADIDYLRAVAVLAVIGFHFGVPGFQGGFVGVDIFFVISGYVISRLIWSGLQAGNFSFAAFYERRARRLLPALYVMIVASGVAASFLAPPNDYQMFFESAVATLLFGSNVYFWQHIGYFDLPSLGKALIHTWSLSVEEQFYFAFPVVTWLWSRLFRDPSSMLSIVLVFAGAVALCALDQHLLNNGETATAFYLAPFRAWEFLIGVLVYLADGWSPEDIRIRRSFALVGSALMLVPVALYHVETPFPGFHALIPCLGAAVFIMAFNRDGERPALPCVRAGLYVGKISYSLYLWHWPVFVLGTAALPLHWAGTPAAMLVLLLATAVLAAASHHGIEAPVRARVAWRGWRLSGMIATAALVLVAVGSLGVMEEGYPTRFAQTQLRLLRYNKQTIEPFYRQQNCFLEPAESFARYDKASCMTFAEGKTNVVLYGDSLAAQYAGALRAYLDPERYNLIQLTASSCAPFPTMNQAIPANCNDVSAAFLSLVDRASVVVLSGNWRYYMMALEQPLPPGEQKPGITTTFDKVLGATLSRLEAHGASVLLIGPSLQFAAPLPTTLARYERTHMDADRPRPLPDFSNENRLRAIANNYSNIRYASVRKALCNGNDCLLKANDDTPVLWDIVHLTPEGAQLVLSRISPVLDEVLAAGRRSPAGRVEAQALPSEKTAPLP